MSSGPTSPLPAPETPDPNVLGDLIRSDLGLPTEAKTGHTAKARFSMSSDPSAGALVADEGDEVLIAGVRPAACAAATALERRLHEVVVLSIAVDGDEWWIEHSQITDLDALAHVRLVVRLASGDTPVLTRGEAIQHIDPSGLEPFFHPRLHTAGLKLLTTGLPASPGAASGQIALTSDEAMQAADRGEAVILIRPETTPDDVLGMQSAKGIITARGGLVSHAAVIARGWGIPAVIGAQELRFLDGVVRIGNTELRSGDHVSLDGGSGAVYRGAAPVWRASIPDEVEILLRWADEVRTGQVGVRANADGAEEVRLALQMGADGIGLCRTEHMFLAADRLPLMRQLIMSEDPEEEARALAALEEVQERDFVDLFSAVGSSPITVRLLDPPLHEFLPNREALVIQEASGSLDDAGQAELQAVRRLTETNPMLGTRGIRLGAIKPGLYPMQVRAIYRALGRCHAADIQCKPEVLIPFVVDPHELQHARRWIANALGAPDAGTEQLDIGVMIETPRAALLAGEFASEADFLSFGTNDLTQLTYAFSRDDIDASVLAKYLRNGILELNPFEELDEKGVGRLVGLAAEEGRAVNPQLKLGACGEHAGNPKSVKFLVACGVNYISCSPYRLPIARLSVARALLDLGGPSLVGTPVDRAAGSAPKDSPAGQSLSGAPPRVVSQVTSLNLEETEYRVLHALRIKGFASDVLVAEMMDLEPGDVQFGLKRADERGLVRFLANRDVWQLLGPGKDRHVELLREFDEGSRVLEASYRRFLELNVRFKALCVQWQMRGDIPNDHRDPVYDGNRISELDQLHRAVEPWLRELARQVGRLGAYQRRLADALDQLEKGRSQMFTGVLCGSYHDVWMELHEDLIQLLAIDRTAEGSF